MTLSTWAESSPLSTLKKTFAKKAFKTYLHIYANYHLKLILEIARKYFMVIKQGQQYGTKTTKWE